MDLSDYDDTPYRERDDVAPVYTISLDLDAVDGYRYAYVDGGDERLARQRFSEAGFNTGSGVSLTVVRWVERVLRALINDPEGRNACGDCGNYVLGGAEEHAPDCRWSRWKQRTHD